MPPISAAKNRSEGVNKELNTGSNIGRLNNPNVMAIPHQTRLPVSFLWYSITLLP